MAGRVENFSSDDEGTSLSFQFKNRGRVRNEVRPVCNSQNKVGEKIATSLYSFTYKQTTGSLLSTRLSAMQHSMQSLDLGTLSEAGLSRILGNLAKTSGTREHRISIPLDDHIRQTNEEMLEFLTVPYLDLSPENISTTMSLSQDPPLRRPSNNSDLSRPPTRPPSMLRRASSMVLNNSEMMQTMQTRKPSQGNLSNGQQQEGIPTPLQAGMKAQTNTQAVFATSASHPYYIRTLNDIACMITGINFHDAHKRSFLDFVASYQAQWLSAKLASCAVSSARVKLCGDLVEINGQLMSVWVEELDNGVFMWTVEEIPNYPTASPKILPDLSEGIGRHLSADGNVILYGGNRCWAPQAIGAAVVLNLASMTIIDYNKAALRAMTGLTEDISGRKFSYFVPQFELFIPEIKQFLNRPGIVIPEHYFRHLAGMPYDAPEFTSPNPSRTAGKCILAVTAATSTPDQEPHSNTCIDLQVRVLNAEMAVVWISYSHSSTPTMPDLLPKIFSVKSMTPPDTPMTPVQTPRLPSVSATPSPPPVKGEPENSELLSIEVGAHRRSLEFEWFEVIKLLGRGAYGEVRLVRTPSKQHVVILKSIFKDRILVDTWSRDRALGTIPNEIRILNQLRAAPHPHIVQMIDFFEDDRCFHLEMLPFGSSPSQDLFDFIEMQSNDANPEFLLQIWQQIASAVAHIHSLGITHRDLKDENIIMDNAGNTKLIDFGSAAYVSQGPFDVFVGTIDYAAPEIAQGKLYEGRPQDAWALGILLYTIMFREPPFNGAEEIIEAKVPEDFSCLGDELIRKLLVENPDDRPSVARCLEILAENRLKLFSNYLDG